MLLDRLLNTIDEPVAHKSCLFTGIGSFDLANCMITCNARKRSCRHCAAAHCLFNLLARRVESCAEVSHNISVSADSACSGISAGNDFAENCKIGINSEIALSTGKSDSEACNNLVEYKKCAVFMAECLCSLYKFLAQRSCSALGTDRLNEYACRAARKLILLELSFKVIEVIREELVRVLEYKHRNTP